MLNNFTSYLRDNVQSLPDEGGELDFEGRKVPMQNGILRFSPDITYSTGNFSKLRERHATLQLDSKNGTQDRHNTLLMRTGWTPDFYKGKTVLECGCGAGPDTETLLKFGARVVAVDLAGVDIAKKNLGEHDNITYIQGDITDLPFKPESFDIVHCHRVLQHTPDPEKTLNHILQFVKPEGAAFVHSYARTFVQMFRWKYALLPFTRRMDSEKLYNFVKWYSRPAFKVTNFLRKIPGGRFVSHFFIPYLNYRHVPKFDAMSDEQMIEYGVHDTFDALSPPYDKPMSAKKMREIASKYLKQPFEIEEKYMVTLLRTKIHENEELKKAA